MRTACSISASGKITLGDLPPSSSDTRLRLPAEACRISLPTSVEPVKATLSMSGCARDRAAGGRAEAGHDIDDAVRNARFADQLAESYRRKRGLLGRFQNQRIAESQGRRDFPADCRERAVPRNDLPANADRLAQRVVEHAGIRGIGLAVELGRPARVIAERVGGRGRLR